MTLRNCPVCRHNETCTFEEGTARRDKTGKIWFINKTETFIECNQCGHQACGWTEIEAQEDWNTRGPAEWELRWWKEHCGM